MTLNYKNSRSVQKVVQKNRSTVFENHRKSLIQHCERSELLSLKTPKAASLFKPEACGQTVLPDRSILIRQKLLENAKNKKIHQRNFQPIFNQNETF